MDSLHRLRHLLTIFIIFFSLSAQAYEERWRPQTAPNEHFPTPEAACAFIVDRANQQNPGYAYSLVSITDQDFRTKHCNYTSKLGSQLRGSIDRQYRCTNGEGQWVMASTSGPPSCYEPPSEPPPEPEPEQCEDGRELDSGYYTSANNPIACIQGCRALRVSTGSPVLNCDLSQGVGVCDYIYPAKYIDTGVECSPSTEPPKETPKPDCPYCRCMESGGSWGTVNGVDTCVPQGSPGSAPVTKPSGPPTVTTTTPAPTPENPDPEPVTEVTPAPVITITPPPAGAPAGTPPTVTETTTDPATGGTITTERDKKTYCQENPAAQICRDDDKSIFSGSCESFRCEGDAIQCAIALKQHQTVCDMQKGDAMSDLGQQLTQGQGGVENPLENPEQVSLDALDTSSFMPKGGLQDMSFSIVGQSFTLPISNLNSGLEFAGYIVLAFAFIAAARIVFM